MGQDYPGSRSLVSAAFELRGVPQISMQITLSSLADSSYRQYETCFKKWWYFCLEKDICPFRASIRDILIFLTNIFNEGAAASSMGCYRAAIGLLVGPEISQDERIRRFFKGLLKIRPMKPKYNTTWDPKIVLNYITSLGKNEDLSMKDLTLKLISLLALTTGHRMQTFFLIRIENIELNVNRIEIKIPDRIKTSGCNRKQPSLVLSYFKKNVKICVASALLCYMSRTKDLRGDIQFLFISLTRPFRSVTLQSLSRWVKIILEKSGLNTNIFTAHSTRHASTSAVKRSGVDIDIVRKTAGWTQSSNTFVKFYNLPLTPTNDTFAKTILNS